MDLINLIYKGPIDYIIMFKLLINNKLIPLKLVNARKK
uniref:Uncharacterized protein n=1 Tax=Myoviridae sp. ctPuP5 TaxID=2823543 RepID=A0A8S5LA59_9CAUD|nr:MAG TPA: hypothetical protein [Myoviridae sp. ctPuP5]